jgi:hypothetical protein
VGTHQQQQGRQQNLRRREQQACYQQYGTRNSRDASNSTRRMTAAAQVTGISQTPPEALRLQTTGATTAQKNFRRKDNKLKGLSHEIDFKNFD